MKRKISRRRFLASSGATLAAASAAAVVGCSRKRASQNATPTAPALPQLAPVTSRGGIMRVLNFDAMITDSLDPHQTMMGPIANMHSAVFSRVLRYADEAAGTLAPDLADGMPEQPDQQTYVIRLRPNVRFHDAPKYRLAYPKTAGRELTADDVQYSIERQADPSSPQARSFYRAGNWSAIDRIDVQDSHTLSITLKRPVAPFLNFLAGRHAFVISPEVVDATDRANAELAMIGTGPFIVEALQPEIAIKVRRNADWFARDDDAAGAGGGRPFLDGYDAVYTPQDDDNQRTLFHRTLVDATGFPDPATVATEQKTNLADIALGETDGGGLLASRLLLDRAPFNDDRVRRAIHLAVDRKALIELLYPAMDGRPSAKLTGPVAPAMGAWALSPDDLSKRPGYRDDATGRAEDIAEAKKLFAAATGDRPTLIDVKVVFGGVPKAIPDRAVAALQQQLRPIGLNVVPVLDPSGFGLIDVALGRNIDGATEGVAPFTFMLEDGGVDIDDWLYPHFRSDQRMNSYRLQDAQLDGMLDKSRAEFDADSRRQMGLDIQNYLVSKVNARIEFAAPVERRLSWGYVRNYAMPMWYGSNQDLANTWLDTSHPAWRARP
ncbi:MAG: ABC transporter substrate-binding protein [Dehalococcoidia bacterium]|nr:MAG: ABC transporter substrate-binding protein [Dehalococcoidia bacterium]